MSKYLGKCPICGKDADMEDGQLVRCHVSPYSHTAEEVARLAVPTDEERLKWEFMRHIYRKGYWGGTADRHLYSD